MTTLKKLLQDLQKNKTHLFQFMLIGCVFFGLRLWAISARSLWFDEAFEYWTAINPLKDIFAVNLSSYQPPLFSVLLHFWLKLGDSPTWMRMLSLVFSFLSAVGLILISYDLFGFNASVIAAILFTVLPTDIRYTQEVAEYELLLFAIVWMVYFQFKAIKSTGWRSWFLLLTFWLVAVYSHYGAAIAIAGSGIWLLIEAFKKKDKAAFFKLGLISILFIILVLPLAPMVLTQQARQSSSSLASGGLFTEAKLIFQSIFQTFSFPISGWPYTKVPKVFIEIITYASAAVLLLFGFKGSKQFKRVLGAFLITSIIYFVMVRTGLYAYGSFGFRYMLILVPLATITLSALVTELLAKEKIVRVAAVLLMLSIVALCFYSLPNRPISQAIRGSTPWPETEDVGELYRYLAANRDDETDIYVYYGAGPAFAYYHQQSRLSEEPTYPVNWISGCWGKQTMGICSSDSIYYGKWIRSLTVNEKLTSIAEQFDNNIPKRFWIVFSHVWDNEDQQILDGLIEEKGYSISDEQKWINAKLYLLSKP